MKPELCANSNCALAQIRSGFTQVEIGARYPQNGLLIIGDAPMEGEARECLPMRPWGQGGSLLADALRECNISRAEVAITDILRCRPPKDYLNGAPYAFNATAHCVQNYLYGVISELKPRAILTLGELAYRSLVAAPKGKYGTLDYARGYVCRGEAASDGVKIIPTYHPAFIRRGAAHLTPLLQRDLRRAFLLATGRIVEGVHYSLDGGGIGLEYQMNPTIDDAWEFARNVDPALPLVFDIETPMSTRSDEDDRTSFTDRDIKLFQCTQHRGSGIALPYRDEYVSVIKQIFKVSTCRVGFNNWNFDDPVLAANGIDVGKTDDAMVMFGTYWSELPKNLQAAAQMCGFPFAWKHYNESDLAFYGICDVDATLCVYEHMTKVLKGEEVA